MIAQRSTTLLRRADRGHHCTQTRRRKKAARPRRPRLAHRTCSTGAASPRNCKRELKRLARRPIEQPFSTHSRPSIGSKRRQRLARPQGRRRGPPVSSTRRFYVRLRASDVVSRIGGDEFAVIAPTDGGEVAARKLAGDLTEAIRTQTVVTSGTARQVTASIGVALLNEQTATSADDLLAAADGAMYSAKRNGRDRIAHAV